MENPCKRFLFISNVVISVLCVAAIACYFIFPLYRISFSATFTKELADAIADNVTVPDEVKIEKTSVNEKTAAEITRSVIKSLGEKGLKISFSQTFYTETFLAAFFEFACYLSCRLNDVNPFNQEGVEEYKKMMFKYLGK